MSLFGKKKVPIQQVELPPAPPKGDIADTSKLARTALDAIKDGVIIVDQKNCIQLINPAALTLIGELDKDLVLGMDAGLSIHLEDENGTKIADEANPILHALKINQPFDSREFVLLSKENNQKFPVEIVVIPTGSVESDRIVTIRDISREKNEGNAQFEFISTASHEMRTPVASIEGYLGLALNPQTATIDDRARGYLEAAHKSSEHLGKLFQDLLDVTKLDDQKVQPNFIPIELTGFIQQLTNNLTEKAREKNLTLSFGPKNPLPSTTKSLSQALYVYIDQRYLNEIVSNLIENAIKYTPEGKNIWVNVTSEENRAIISVEDTGIGISGTDQQHIFQKFYRADNSQTREIGGTGLGLYLVKQRTEALHGSVWVESIYGKGSTFFVALPRLTPEEYQKRKIQSDNESQMMKNEQMKEYQEAISQQSEQIPVQQSAVTEQPASQQSTSLSNQQMPVYQEAPAQAIDQPVTQEVIYPEQTVLQQPIVQTQVSEQPAMQQPQDFQQPVVQAQDSNYQYQAPQPDQMAYVQQMPVQQPIIQPQQIYPQQIPVSPPAQSIQDNQNILQ